MKVIALNGSPKKEGNTYLALKKSTDILNELGIETEIIQIGDKDMKGCIACGGCNEGVCAFGDDFFKMTTQKMYDSDGIIIGSPVYYAGVNGTLKSFLDRAFFQSAGRMSKKIGAAIAICRRTGGMTAFEQINAYYLIADMFIAPSTYWNVGHGRSPGEILDDLEAMSTFELLSRNIAWFLQMKEATKDTVALPAKVEKIAMGFFH